MTDFDAGKIAQPGYLAYSNSGLAFKASFDAWQNQLAVDQLELENGNNDVVFRQAKKASRTHLNAVDRPTVFLRERRGDLQKHALKSRS
jgi:hypothetical protein